MKSILFVLSCLTLVACTTDSDLESRELHTTYVPDNNPSRNHHLINDGNEETVLFDIILDIELRGVVLGLYKNMYGDRFLYEGYLSHLNTHDVGSHNTYRALSNIYLNLQDPKQSRVYYDIIMLTTQVASSSSIGFLGYVAKGKAQICSTDHCVDWEVMTKALAVTGLYRINLIRSGYDTQITQELTKIISDPGNEKYVVVEAIHMLKKMGQTNNYISNAINSEYSDAMNYQFVQTLD